MVDPIKFGSPQADLQLDIDTKAKTLIEVDIQLDILKQLYYDNKVPVASLTDFVIKVADGLDIERLLKYIANELVQDELGHTILENLK